jgi:hypothetical protein
LASGQAAAVLKKPDIKMGRLTAGPFYDMIGKTGNNVGRKIRGSNVFSITPHPSNKEPTELKKTVQDSLGLVSAWLAPARVLINIGFKNKTGKQSAMNAAVSANIGKVIAGVYPDIMINYSKATFSTGALSLPADATMTATVADQIDVSWSTILENTIGSLYDQTMLLIYNEDKNDHLISFENATRGSKMFAQPLPVSWTGNRVHGYLFFRSPHGKQLSDTAYLGTLELL